jgi:predicted nuclease of predicted toxin-antitoxin system
MKLLFDANLSPRLVRAVIDFFPGAVHVFDCGEIYDDDQLIWAYAARHHCIIVTKDGDFQSLSLVRGAPPKVVWLRVGNAGTAVVATLLRARLPDVELFDANPEASLLVLDA